MEYIVSFIWISLELLSMFFACKAFLPQRKNNTYALLLLIIAGIIILIQNNLPISPFSAYPALRKGISFFIYIFTLSLIFAGPWYSRLLITFLTYFAVCAVDTVAIYGTAAVLGLSVSEFVWKRWLYTVAGSMGKCMLLFLTWALIYFRDRKGRQMRSRKRLLLLSLFPFASIVMLYAMFNDYRQQDDLSTSVVIFSVILMISNAAIIYLMTSLERAARAEQEIAVLNQSMALQVENIQTLEKSYRAQRQATHEFKHQLQVIRGLLESGDSAKAREYIGQLQNEQSAYSFAVNTKHPVVDAILNDKYRMAKENDVDINFKVNDLSALTANTDAIVVLLSNLLDNALEACLRLTQERRVECTLLLEDDLFLSIGNTSPAVTIKNGRIETSKEPKHEHGFGLAGVRRILSQLGGEYDMSYAENWFQFVAEIPIYVREE